MSFRELLNGSLVGRVIRVRFWRVPFAAIPTGRAARVEWLYDWWSRLDAWIGAQQPATSIAAVVAAPAAASR